ncbi:MAG TPA: hypothetical protein VHB46_01050 [Burkholderiales bacterium]|nr:hypothetical protein [Burkholderiales bacterium]
MLTKLVVDLYGWIIEIFLWFVLLIAAIAGFRSVVPILQSRGWILESDMGWRIAGAVVFPLATFLVLAVVLGPILLLVDIRKSVRSLEAAAQASRNDDSVPPIEHREPHL